MIGKTTQLIYPYGSDVGDWHEYSGEKYRLLIDSGFRYFFNVDASQHAWKQVGPDYFRQARINVDGFVYVKPLLERRAYSIHSLMRKKSLIQYDRNGSE